MKQALNNHLIARVLSFKSNFREAILYEKEACKTYRSILGDEHEKTKESTDFLKHLTQQAVSLQKTMNAMKNKENVKANLPVPCPPPASVSKIYYFLILMFIENIEKNNLKNRIILRIII